MPEATAGQLEAKLHHIGQLVSDLRIDRIRLWREMARLEQLRGNDLVSATYRLRAMRLAGEDGFHDLAFVSRTLSERGYPQEAFAARAMYGDHTARDAHCQELLDGALERHRDCRPKQFEFVDDRRARTDFRASVIVSLYNAADKLPLFLETLGLQTMLRAGQAEVVLIDSGSPGSEYQVFRAWIEQTGLPVVYARSAQRESIQAAWNRGIELSRGEYLSFLGVDEAILPQTLQVLAAELDSDRTLDWVQGNSLVTNVDERGHWANDIMTYDRTDYDQPLVYLETCYLSWVGSLYRRRIHERLGYYDATFGAAGDTEFKNRVLPFIRSRVIPRTLGVFWNYPSGQTTCSPRAEIEDLRAWYLHRTPAGVRYALQNSDLHVAESLLYSALQYRKSYCRHWSTDVEYAHSLAEFLRVEHPDASAIDLFDGICKLLETYRLLDWLPHISQQSLRGSLEQANDIAREIAAQHRHLSAERIQPVYDVFNDNRYEQHNQLWRSAA
jgi:glycosyltransferase involved in cell wall biosynthesis